METLNKIYSFITKMCTPCYLLAIVCLLSGNPVIWVIGALLGILDVIICIANANKENL